MTKAMVLPVAALLTLAACAPKAEETATAPVAGEGACDATAAQAYVGKALTEDMQTAALRATGSKTVRVIRPGMAVTMDYRQDRLNIEVDEAGVIKAVRCG